MELPAHSHDQELLIAEHAAEWLLRSHLDEPREKERLLDWLCRSPQHSGELLAATSLDLVLRQAFRNRSERIDVDELLAASVNVLTLRDRIVQSPRPARGKRSRLFAAASLGVAATTVALVVTPTPVRTWLYPCAYTAPASDHRVVELTEGSAIAINAGSGVLVLFAASARDVYAEGGQPMFAAAEGLSRPFRVRIVTSPTAASSGTDASTGRALGGNVDELRRLGLFIQGDAAITPPMTINVPALNPGDSPVVIERHGSEVLIR